MKTARGLGLLLSAAICFTPARLNASAEDPTPVEANLANHNCGNQKPGSPTDPPCDCDETEAVGVNRISAASGNATRRITDLSVGGRAFAPDLTFTRHSHTRWLASSQLMGQAANWRHNHQWELTTTASDIQVGYPAGRVLTWTKKPDGSNDAPQFHSGDRLYKESGKYRLSLAGGAEVVFHPEVVSGTGARAIVERATDPMGRTLWYTNDGTRVTGVADDFGRTLVLEYGAPVFVPGAPALTPANPAPTVLRKVTASDGREVTYHYQVANEPGTAHQAVVLAEAQYGGGAPAKYEYIYNPQRLNTRPLLHKCEDPMYGKGAVRVQYEHIFLASAVNGMVWKERNPLTGALLNFRQWPAGQGSQTVSPNGMKQKHVFDGAAITTEYEEKDADGTTVSHRKQIVGTFGGKKMITQKKALVNGVWRTTNLEHDWRCQNVKTVAPDGAETQTAYDAAGRVTQVKEIRPGASHARVTSTAYNAQGWVISVTVDTLPSTAPQTTTYAYTLGTEQNINGQPLQTVTPDGLVTRYAYDADGRLLEARVSPDPDAVPAEWAVTTYEYGDPLLGQNPDRLVRVTDPLGRVTEYETNWRGQATFVIHPDATAESWVYDDFGNMVAHSDELGKVTFYTYDEFRRIRTRTDPLSHVTEWRYGIGAAGCGSCHVDDKPTEIISPSGRSVKYEYDLKWRLTRQIEAAGAAEESETEFVYDMADRLISRTDPLDRETLYTYDNLSDELLTVTDALGRLTEYDYDEWGNVVETTLPGGRFVQTEYDEWNRPVSVTRGGAAQSETVETEYDSLGRVTAVIDPKSGAYEYTYDAWGRAVSQTQPDAGTASVTYNIGGQVIERIPRAGAAWKQELEYDLRGRVTALSFGGNFPGIIRTARDDAGRPVSVTTHTLAGAVESAALTTVAFTYDDAGRMTEETLTLNVPGDTRGFTTAYTHDADGRVLEMTQPSGTAIQRTYDARGLLGAVTRGGTTDIVTITRNAAGEELSRIHNNGWATTTTRDIIGRPTAITALDDSSHHGVTVGYTWNVRDEIEQRTRKYAAAPVLTDDFTHDQLSQITAAKHNAGTGQELEELFTYDLNGNRTAYDDAGNNKTAQFDAKNQLTQYDGSNTTQDANGNLTKALGLSITDISYDALNRPVEIDAGSENLTLIYDGLGRMVRIDATGGSMEDTTLVYDNNWQVTEEYGSGSTPKRQFIYGSGIDEVLVQREGSEDITLHRDLLGSPLMASAENGDILRQYHPTGAFGRTKIHSGPGTAGPGNEITQSLDPLRISFTGRTVLVPGPTADNPILLDYRHRVYSPMAGRFLQQDPIGFEGGDVNLYRYVGNGVLRALDPYGLQPGVFLPSGATTGSFNEVVQTGLTGGFGPVEPRVHPVVTGIAAAATYVVPFSEFVGMTEALFGGCNALGQQVIAARKRYWECMADHNRWDPEDPCPCEEEKRFWDLLAGVFNRNCE